MSTGDVDHERNDVSRRREADLVRKLEHRGDGPLLLVDRQVSERSWQMATGAGHRGATRSVVPGGRRVQPSSAPIDADQVFLDQEPIIGDDLHD